MYKLRVKEILKEQGKTGRELAAYLGMTEVGLYKAIGDNGNPSLSRLNEIASFLNVEIYELFIEPSEKGENVNGFIEVGGSIYKIDSFEDLEKILKLRE